MAKAYNDEEKQKALKCLKYEIDMLKATAEYLMKNKMDQVLSNALLESFLIHARALIDFLYKDTSRYADDVLAVKFFSSPEEWIKARGDKSEYLKAIQNDIHKWLAHISIVRKESPEKKKWDFAKIIDEIFKVIVIFEKKTSLKCNGKTGVLG